MFIRDKQHKVGNRVKELRKAKSMTQDDLANRVNATRQTIISIEKGNYVPSVLLALKIASVLSCSVEEVFWFEKV